MRRTLLLALACVAATAHAQTPPTWHLQLDHAIRPVEGSDGILGDVSSIAVAHTGVVYVAERKAARVARYDRNGKFTVVMREGSGPGEVRAPVVALQGDTLVVFDATLARLTRVSPAGTLLGSRPFGDPSDGTRSLWTTANGAILVDATSHVSGMRSSAVRLLPTGRVDTIAWNDRFDENQWRTWTYPGGMIKGGPFNVAARPAFDPAGRVVFGGSRLSRWYVVSGRDTLRRVVLDDHPVTIPTGIRDSAWDAFMASVKNLPGAGAALKKETLATSYAAWLSLDITPDGEWWIGRPGIDGSLASWDVVDNGTLVGHVAAPSRILRGQGIYIKAFGSSLIALVQEDENDVPWIGVYRIVRGK